MKARLAVLSFALLSACSRDFSPPPEHPVVSAFSPGNGFTGDPVAICGQHFATEAKDNLVYFGTVAVEEILDQRPEDLKPDPGLTCADSELWARVPLLAEEGPVTITVSTPAGQATSDESFDYRGPGHPVNARLTQLLDVRSGLWGVFSPEGVANTLAFGTFGIESRIMSLFEMFFGLHLDIGVCNYPISVAAAVQDIDLEVYLRFVIYGTTLELLHGDAFGVRSQAWRWVITIADILAGKFEAPEIASLPATSDGEPFLPSLVWSYPRTGAGELGKQDIVITHLSRAALVLIPTSDPDSATLVELPDQAPACAKNDDTPLGPIADLVYDEVEKHFYATMAGSNEIWRIPAETRDIQRVWPPPAAVDYAETILCGQVFGPLAIRRSHLAHNQLRLYAGELTTPHVREFRLETPVNGDEYVVPDRALFFDGLPYDLMTGRYRIDLTTVGERLYVAIQNGLVVLDITDPNPLLPGNPLFVRVGEIPLPRNRGGVQSIANLRHFNPLTGDPDTVLFVDSAGDRVVAFRCGFEGILLGDIATGSTFPQLVTSYRDERFYLADSLSNAVHVVDRKGGQRIGQFPIASLTNHDTMGIGSFGMTNLRSADADLLMLPLATEINLQSGTGDAVRNREIAYASIQDELPACALTQSELRINASVDEEFDAMLLVWWDLIGGEPAPVLVMTRNFLQRTDAEGVVTETPGTVWCMEIDAAAASEGNLVLEPVPICDLDDLQEIGPDTFPIIPARDTPAFIHLETVTDAQGEPALHLRIRDLLAQEDPPTYVLDEELGAFITDMRLLQRGTAAAPIHQVFFALHDLGQVLVVTFDAGGDHPPPRVIPIGGDPSFLFFSPDGRRLYTNHILGGQITVIDTDCQPAGACESVDASVSVDAWPGLVTFDDTGRTAYVQHFFSSDISVIE